MNIKGLLITLVAIVGFFFLAELVMPGHTDRFLTYMQGNWEAFLTLFNEATA